MVRVLLAFALCAIVSGSPAPASAGAKIIRVQAKGHIAKHRYVRHRHRPPRIVALAVPRCHAKRRTVHGHACPRIAWAGSARRQAWSYEVFRTKARWHQRSALWQSHIRPSRMNPTIYWGY